MNRNERLIPSLDGVRAIAIVLVCLGHLTWNQRLLGRDGQYLRLGEIGVRIFFVLSGYLITGILLRELDRTSTLSLRRFYFRRTLRIFPAYYTFVGVMVVLNALQVAQLYHGSAFTSLSYTADIVEPGKRVFGHTWSLAVEEQFYLLWPAALSFLGRRRALRIAGVMLLVCPAMRVVSVVLMGPHAGLAPYLQNPQFRFDTQADALAVGCLLAGLRTGLHGYGWYRRLLMSRAFLLVPVLGVIVTVFGRQQFGPLYLAYLVVGYAVTNVAIACSLDWCLTHPAGTIGRFLNATPVATLGLLSYSIYLWQEPFLYVGRSEWWQVPPANIGLTVVAASASYICVERPCLRFRKAWEQRICTNVGSPAKAKTIAIGDSIRAEPVIGSLPGTS